MQNFKYINYNRKSTDSEDKQVLSISAQENFAIEQAGRYGLNIVDSVEESKSAKIPGLRPRFKEMLTGIRRGKYNAIICWKLDRLARNMIEGGELMELLQQGVIKEIRTSEKIYLPNENTILLAVVFASANQSSRELSVNVSRGLETRAKLGLPSGVAPFGFINDKGVQGNRKWMVDEERLEVTRAIFNKVLEGMLSAKRVYRWAIETFHPTTLTRTRIGGKKLAESSFYTMLRNPVYAGFFEYNGVRYDLDKALPRLITEKQFYAIQYTLDTGKPSSSYRYTPEYVGFIKSPDGEFVGADLKFHLVCDCKHKFSYVHKTHCPKCGIAITDMKSPKYRSYTYYYNSTKKKRRESVKTVSEAIIDGMVGKDLRELQMSENLKAWMKKYLLENPDNTEQELAKKRWEKSVSNLQEKITRLRDLVTDGILSKEEYLHDKKAAEQELALLYANKNEHTIESLDFDKISNAYDSFNSGVEGRKREVLKSLSSNLTWDEENLCVIWPEWLYILKMGLIDAKAKNREFEPEKTLAEYDESDVFKSVRLTLCQTLDDVRTFYEKEHQ